ncbi:hypothetical protein GCM10020369_73890 [Cryptosporangium minutisporangium]|uniref:Uncharacterized protein n=2 Tax=Cryptosporangium minutisporangium TaxID=113569 RepID=A0ABP6T9E5_9ACTN
MLADPTGALTRLREAARDYPPALRDRVVTTSLWEADFALAVAREGAGRGDTTCVAGCLFRVVGLCAHAVHAHAGAWLINEKGAVDAAAALSGAPLDFAEAAHGVLACLGRSVIDLEAALRTAGLLVEAVAATCGVDRRK